MRHKIGLDRPVSSQSTSRLKLFLNYQLRAHANDSSSKLSRQIARWVDRWVLHLSLSVHFGSNDSNGLIKDPRGRRSDIITCMISNECERASASSFDSAVSSFFKIRQDRLGDEMKNKTEEQIPKVKVEVKERNILIKSRWRKESKTIFNYVPNE